MTTYTKSKCKVMFAQCSGNRVISSCTVCITLLNSEDVPTMGSISITQNLVLPDITVIVLSISQFFLCPHQLPGSPRFHPRFTCFLPRLSHLPRSLSRIPRNHDHRIMPMITESRPRLQPWHGIFCPRVVLNAFLERICCFCSVFFYIQEASYSSE